MERGAVMWVSKLQREGLSMTIEIQSHCCGAGVEPQPTCGSRAPLSKARAEKLQVIHIENINLLPFTDVSKKYKSGKASIVKLLEVVTVRQSAVFRLRFYQGHCHEHSGFN